MSTWLAGPVAVETALADLAAGRPVVVLDDADRENEGDLVIPAEAVTAELIAFMMRECGGLICAALAPEVVDRLRLPQMVRQNTESMRTAFTVSVDAAEGVSTGISASDRATTLRLLADPTASPTDLVRPGHIFPLRARPGGVLERRGHTEAAVDLARLAGWQPAAAIVEIAGPDGRMLRAPGLRSFAETHGWALLSIGDLVAWRTERAAAPGGEPPTDTDPRVRRSATVRLPTRHGAFQAYGYHVGTETGGEPNRQPAAEQLALVVGDLGDGTDVLVRIHSECLTGDVFGSLRCDCGPQLDAALQRILAEGCGVLLYLRGHEGRGIGLLAKMRAYELQEQGRDTVDANLELGLPADARDYAAAGLVLNDLGVRSVRLITNNPRKVEALEAAGIRVLGREPQPTPTGRDNLAYLRTKRDRMGHDLPWLDDSATLTRS